LQSEETVVLCQDVVKTYRTATGQVRALRGVSASFPPYNFLPYLTVGEHLDRVARDGHPHDVLSTPSGWRTGSTTCRWSSRAASSSGPRSP
jgi:hypothetical protein